MHKKITILVTIIVLSMSAIQVQAGDIILGDGLAIEQDSGPKTSTMKSRIDKLSKPHDDIKISDGVSAGVISGREDYTMKNDYRTPAKEKGREVGVGISLSF